MVLYMNRLSPVSCGMDYVALKVYECVDVHQECELKPFASEFNLL